MAASDYIPLNFTILANPVNWIIVVLMVAMAGLALSILFPADTTAARG